ncbi:hypothetical protein P7K49_007111, partial [Saguinus oedipus]
MEMVSQIEGCKGLESVEAAVAVEKNQNLVLLHLLALSSAHRPYVTKVTSRDPFPRQRGKEFIKKTGDHLSTLHMQAGPVSLPNHPLKQHSKALEPVSFEKPLCVTWHQGFWYLHPRCSVLGTSSVFKKLQAQSQAVNQLKTINPFTAKQIN